MLTLTIVILNKSLTKLCGLALLSFYCRFILLRLIEEENKSYQGVRLNATLAFSVLTSRNDPIFIRVIIQYAK